MHEDDKVLVKGWCLVCKDVTPHTFRSFNCTVCRDKDRQDMETALDRFRVAEGADYPEQGDMFDAGDGDENIRHSER